MPEIKNKYKVAPLEDREENKIYLHPTQTHLPVTWHPAGGSEGYARSQFRCVAHKRNINSCKDCGVSNLFCSWI